MFRPLRDLIILLSISTALGTRSSGDSSDGSSRSTISSSQGVVGDSVVFTASNVTLPKPTVLGNATCESRTANHITHTLPQQCLRTDWAPGGSNSTALTSSTNRSHSFQLGSIGGASSPTSSGSSIESTSALSNASTSTSAPTAASSPTEDADVIPGSVAEVMASSSARPSVSNETPSLTSAAAVSEAETDSPLDDALFLSFEEWKKQNLEKAGQSPENVGQARVPAGGERKRSSVDNALDTLGEDSEIELDFSGFGDSSASEHALSQPLVPSAGGHSAAPASPSLRSKDAGKTCKERTNYASFDCAATVLKSNPECKSASSVLVENKDSYMLNTCSAKNKFFIVELCNDIHIDTIVLANYEFFSSIFRTFRLSVSDRYPVKLDRWRVLGTFEARNTREVQAFLVEEPQIWARYLRIEFLTRYGNEYYCPVSLLRVHGTTMMEEFRHEEEVARGEDLDEDDESEYVESGVKATLPEPAVIHDPKQLDSVLPIASITTVESERHPDSTLANMMSTPAVRETSPNWWTTKVHSGLVTTEPSKLTCLPTSISHATSISVRSSNAALSISTDSIASTVQLDTTTSTEIRKNHSPSTILNSGTTAVDASTTASQAPSLASITNSVSAMLPKNPLNSTMDVVQGSANISTATAAASSTTSHEVRGESKAPHDKAQASPSQTSGSSQEPAKQASSASTSPQSQPSTQESFFKSVHKRLQALESNASLSLQYIESQSVILRDAFAKVEKRQLARTTEFLETLNKTVLGELHGFRQAYDQIWQSTVVELEGHRERYEREMLALSSRMTLVADELVWQKRMGIVQSTLPLLCLGLVIVLFARAGNGSLEMPIVQQMVQRSQSALKHDSYYSPPHSPSPDQSPASVRRRSLWRRSAQSTGSGHVSDDSQALSRPQSKDGPDMHQPPTPESQDEQSEVEEEVKSEEVPSETKSGPATPTGTRERVKRPPSWPGEDERPRSPLRPR